MGPGPGERGGEIVFYGKVAELLKCKRSRTGQALRERMSPPRRKRKKTSRRKKTSGKRPDRRKV
jgi:excinuclease ABC subunit A